MTEKKSTGWQSIRRQIGEWRESALIALVKDLYEASPDNRVFLHARFEPENHAGAAFEKYRRKIVEQFFPARGFGKLKLGEARKAIRDYRKATGNLEGTMDLMLAYVENGTEFTREFGDIDESFYDSLESVLNDLAQLLVGSGKEVYPKFRERVQRLATLAQDIGWGYGDTVRDQVYRLEDELAGE